MRKKTFVSPLCRSILFYLIAPGIICLPAIAQDSKQTAAPTPTSVKEAPATVMPPEPTALMQAAAGANGLLHPIRPWHLKATFKLYKITGAVQAEGSLEEYWVSPLRFKRTFTFDGFTRTEYGASDVPVYTGAEKMSLEVPLAVEQELIAPLPDARDLLPIPFEQKDLNADGLHMTCISVRDDVHPVPDYVGHSFCLQAGKPVLLFSSTVWAHIQCMHNRIQGFQGRYVAGDLQFFRDGKLSVSAHLENLESFVDADPGLLTAPAQARPIEAPLGAVLTPSGPVILSEKISQGQLIRVIQPVYPPIAKAAHVSGVVEIQAVISKWGELDRIHVLSGPAMLQQASIDCVRQWKYRPYLLNGVPVAVETTIRVTYTLDN